MAHVKIPPPTVIDGWSNIRTEIGEDIFHGAQEGTELVLEAISGTVDPYTEEITVHTSCSWVSASGITGNVVEDDILLGVGGEVELGMLKITYPFLAVSGYLLDEIKYINFINPIISGLYTVKAINVDVVANTDVFVDFALVKDHYG